MAGGFRRRERLAPAGKARACTSCWRSGFSARSRLSRAGRPADIGGSKRQALLALLALRPGRVVGVDALVDGLWGERLPAAPRNALQHHVARLRAALGEGSIVSSPDGYAVNDALVDAVRFEELLAETRAALRDGDPSAAEDAVDAALTLWRGPALQGLTGTTWLDEEARRLETLRVDALEERFEAALGSGTTASSRRRSGRRWRQPVPRAAVGPADAGALPKRAPGRRPRDVPRGAPRARRRTGDRAGPRLRRLQDAILATTRRSPPSPSSAGTGTSLPPRRRSSAAIRSSGGWPSCCASTGS